MTNQKLVYQHTNGNNGANNSNSTPASSAIHACSLSRIPYPKEIHVEQQNRYIVERRRCKSVTKGIAVTVYETKSEKDGTDKVLVLKDMWAYVDWMPTGTLVNIIDPKTDENGAFVVERDHGYLIVSPDTLVSATSIIGQMYCERKAALARMNNGGDNILMFRGVVAHELICVAMVRRIKDHGELKKAVKRICRRPEMVEKAYACRLSDAELESLQTDIINWVSRFTCQRFLKSSPNDPKYQDFQFKKILGVEDTVWNPSFGLKGKIDATVSIEKDSIKKVVPLEFKTGSTKAQKRQQLKADHMGQVALYTLMMSIKYGKVEDAILYYISDDSISLHRTKLMELQYLILNRNKYLRHSTLVNGDLPYLPKADADFDFQCKSCELKSVCTLKLRKTQNSAGPSYKLSVTENKLLESFKLSEKEIKFFEDWLQVINSETEEVEKRFSDKYLWTKAPSEREAAGTCIAGLTLFGECVPFDDGHKMGFLVSFTRPSTNLRSPSLEDTNFKPDEFIVLSSNVEVCISYGVMVAIKKDEITLYLEQPLHEDYVNADFTYSIDKISTTSPIASQYGYLLKLMDDTPEAARLRDYIINEKQPKFLKMGIPDAYVSEIIKNLNAEQSRVIFKSLTTDSFLFVKGIPGSGKTTTIVGLLRTLIYHKHTVLVVSYTNSALDNILLKYKKYDKNFIKIGTSSKVDPRLNEFTTKTISSVTTEVDQLTETYNFKPLIGTTLLSLKHPIFQIRKFDYCVIDEASQALPTAVFGALSFAQKYIVFGDPHQLPPVMQSSIIKQKNLSDNFFSLMATPVSSIKLTTQYRMNRTITKLANELVYENKMVCGSTSQEKARIEIGENDLRSFLKEKVTSIAARQLLCKAVSKKLDRAVMFFDTSNISAFETRADESLLNEAERYIVMAILRQFIDCKFKPTKLGIIAPYRGQVNLIRASLKKMKNNNFHGIEVNTVDQYQGREMEVIICSFTKSLPRSSPFFTNNNKEVKDEGKVNILEDLRRLNVAITRAQRKLVLIGNRNTLVRFAPFEKLFSILTEEQIFPVTQDTYSGLELLAKSETCEEE